MRGSWHALTIVVAVLLMPSGLSQGTTIDNPTESTPSTLYFHIFDTFNKFVINTQPMDSEFFEVGGSNFFTLRDTPANQVYPIASNQDPGADPVAWDFNTIYGISTAGPVEYDFNENGKPRFHPEAGIAQTVKIDDAVEPVVTLYATMRDVLGGPDLANGMPDVTIRITVREGDDPGRETETLDAGRPIMQGQQQFHVIDSSNCDATWGETGQCAPADGNEALAGQTGPDGIPVVTPDADGILEFQIPLSISQSSIPKAEAFNVRIDVYQGTSSGTFEDDQFAQGYLRYYADPDHLPRLDFAITNPIFIEFVHPQVAADSLLIHAGVNSPWGTYDVDVGNVSISIDGPMQVTENDLQKIVSANTHVHGLHDQAAEITYLWKFREQDAPEGEYTITFAVNNVGVPGPDGRPVPGTRSVATAEAGFVISGKEAFGIDTEGQVVEGTAGEGVEAPALGVVPLLALFGTAIILMNRRTFQ